MSQIYEKQPDNQTVIYYYSYFLIRTSNIEKAVEILKTSTDSYSKYYLLSHAYSLINNKEESLSMLRKSFDLNPLFQPVLFKLLLIFYKTSRVKKALKICRLIEHGNPDFSRVEIYRALLYMRQKRFDLAVLSVKAYSKKISTPLPPYIRMLTFISLYYDGKTEKTIKLLSDEIRKYGKKPSLLVLLALCFKRKYAVTELKKTEKQLLTLFPDSPLFLEYKKRHIDMNSEQFKRNDLGLRILNLIKPQSL